MKILHVVHQYPPEYIGGTELYTRMLARRQVEQGHRVSIFVPSTGGVSDRQSRLEQGVEIIRFQVTRRSPFRLLLNTFAGNSLRASFADSVNAVKPDIVHIQHLRGIPAAIHNDLLRAGIPYLVTLHDYWFKCGNAQLLTNYDNSICGGPNYFLNCGRCGLARAGLPDNVPFGLFAAPPFAARNQLLAAVLSGASLLIAPTEFVRDTYIELGCTAAKIRVVAHGIGLPKIRPSRRTGDDHALKICYVGGLAHQKGVHILVDALNQLVDENISLTIHGDETAFPDYVARLKKNAQHPGILFGGPINRQELWQLLADSDVVAVPSLWFETASLIIQEAFAMGVPVIASRIGALEERVADGQDGMLVTPGDAHELAATLSRIIRNPDLLAHLRHGIGPVRTIAEHTAEIESLYKGIISSSL